VQIALNKLKMCGKNREKEIQNSSFNDMMLSTVQHITLIPTECRQNCEGSPTTIRLKRAESKPGGIDRGWTISTEIHNHHITQKRTQA
jgi:hypothetical protein